MKQILVVGAGSVGGFFGAHLAKTNPTVSFLLRPKTLAAVITTWFDDPQRQRQFYRAPAALLESSDSEAGSDCVGREGL